MRIAMISEHASPLAALGGVDAGGQNTHVAELAVALAGHGHQVRVYTRRDSHGAAQVVPMADGVDVVHVPAGPATPLPKDELLPYMGAFAEWMAVDWRDEWKPDVAHAHFWMSGLAAVGAGHACGVPVVQTFHALGSVKRRHQGEADTSPPGRIGVERRLGRTADRVIVQCRDEIDELLRLSVPRSRMALVPSGVNTERFSPRGPAVARARGRSRILTVARLVERKGIEDTILALPGVPGAELVIVGGPPADRLHTDPYARKLLALAERAVSPTGSSWPALSRRTRCRRGTDRRTCSRRRRGTSRSGSPPLEAMACGVPVVATGVGGLTDTVVEGVTGDLTPPRDPQALAAALRRLIGDEQRRLSYAAAAAARAVACYSWPRIAGRLAAVYARVADLEVAA